MSEQSIHDEFETRRGRFPNLSSVDVWIVETIGYDQMSGEGNRGFVLYARRENGMTVEEFALQDGKLLWRSPR